MPESKHEASWKLETELDCDGGPPCDTLVFDTRVCDTHVGQCQVGQGKLCRLRRRKEKEKIGKCPT